MDPDYAVHMASNMLGNSTECGGAEKVAAGLKDRLRICCFGNGCLRKYFTDRRRLIPHRKWPAARRSCRLFQRQTDDVADSGVKLADRHGIADDFRAQRVAGAVHVAAFDS